MSNIGSLKTITTRYFMHPVSLHKAEKQAVLRT